jgi:L-malate glycosyltransferase
VGQSPGILQVVLSLNPGGTERLVVELTRAAALQFRVAVCCIDEPGTWGMQLRDQGFDVFALHREPGFQPQLGWHLAHAAKLRGLRVLHCHHYSPYVYGCMARMVSPGLRVILTEHGRLSDQPPTAKRRMVTPVLAALGHDLISVSEDLRTYMIAAGFPQRLRVIPNGIEIGPEPGRAEREQARALLGVDERTLVIGSVGRLDPVKDFPMLVRAFGIVHASHPDSTLVLIGDGDERRRIEEAIAALPVPHGVRPFGHREDVRRLLPGVDVFVNTSVSEGISLTLLEAMAACLPVVATAVGGTPEVVLHGKTGLLIPARDPAPCAAAIAELLGSARIRAEFGSAGRQRVEEVFNLDRMREQYLGLYARLAV